MKKGIKGIEVLAPIPSYEEWKQLRKFLEEFNALDVAKENQQLKELLWSCQAYFNNQLNDNWAKSIVMDIDNAIGEK